MVGLFLFSNDLSKYKSYRLNTQIVFEKYNNISKRYTFKCVYIDNLSKAKLKEDIIYEYD